MTLVTLLQYKAESFIDSSESLFENAWSLNPYGLTEDMFEAWINKQRMFSRWHSGYTALNDMCLPLKKWGFFKMHFELQSKRNYLVSRFPDGWFEARNDEGMVACFLPEPSELAQFRVAFYRDNGPIYHEVYNDRLEALGKMAHGGFSHCDGALDELEGTDTWNRGVWITKWLADGLSPMQCIKDNQHLAEIQHLFSNELSQLCSPETKAAA